MITRKEVSTKVRYIGGYGRRKREKKERGREKKRVTRKEKE